MIRDAENGRFVEKRFELLAEIPGTYAIELLEAERQIGTLEISG